MPLSVHSIVKSRTALGFFEVVGVQWADPLSGVWSVWLMTSVINISPLYCLLDDPAIIVNTTTHNY